MKILQLNIWGGKLGKQIIEILKKEQPDVVCFQEVISLPVHDTLFFTALKELEEFGNYHSFFSPVFGFDLMKQKAEFGNAILSTQKFLDKKTVFTRREYNGDVDMLDKDYNIRNLQHVSVEHEGQRLHILNHHGHHLHEHKNGDDETMRQCKMIVDYIEKLDGPAVLCGDFNLAPDSVSLDQINAIMSNHAKDSGATTTRTELTKKTEVCDYIFTSSDIEVTEFKILDDIASDHKALTIEIK